MSSILQNKDYDKACTSWVVWRVSPICHSPVSQSKALRVYCHGAHETFSWASFPLIIASALWFELPSVTLILFYKWGSKCTHNCLPVQEIPLLTQSHTGSQRASKPATHTPSVLLPTWEFPLKCQIWKGLALSLGGTNSFCPRSPKDSPQISAVTWITCQRVLYFPVSQQWDSCGPEPCFCSCFLFCHSAVSGTQQQEVPYNE